MYSPAPHPCPALEKAVSHRPRKHNSPLYKRVTLADFTLQSYLFHCRARKRSDHVDERIARQHILPTLGPRCLADLRRYDIDLWLQDLTSLGLAPSTLNRILAVLRSICRLAQAHGIILSGQSPCQGLPDFRIYNRRERFLTQEECGRLKKALQGMTCIQARIVELLLLTGARKGEILNARWEYVDLDRGLLLVPLSKNNKPRHITLSPAAIALIRALPRYPGCPWLFPGRTPGKPLSDIYHFWNDLRCKLGLEDVRIHDLRHTFASILVNNSHSLYEVQRLLGHADPRTSMRYAHLAQESLFAATQYVSWYLEYGEKRKSKKRKLSKANLPKREQRLAEQDDKGKSPIRRSSRLAISPGLG